MEGRQKIEEALMHIHKNYGSELVASPQKLKSILLISFSFICYPSNALSIAVAIAIANKGGTAFPICKKAAVLPPSK